MGRYCESGESSSDYSSEAAKKKHCHAKAIQEKDQKYSSNFPYISNQFLNDLRLDGFLTDVVFKVDGKEFPAHKMVLSCRSEVFHSMFASGMSESTINSVINITDVDADSFARFLDIMYMADTSFLKQNPIPIFKCAHKYNVTWLMKECEEIIRDSINWDTFDTYWELAGVYEPYGLKDTLINFLRVNCVQMLTQHWDEFSTKFDVLGGLIDAIAGSFALIRFVPTPIWDSNGRRLSVNYFSKSGKNAQGSENILPHESKGIELGVELRKRAKPNSTGILTCYLTSARLRFARDYWGIPPAGVPLMVYISIFHNCKRILAKELHVKLVDPLDEVKIFAIHLGSMRLEELVVQIGACYVYKDCVVPSGKNQLDEIQKSFCSNSRLHFAGLEKWQAQQGSVKEPVKNAISRLVQLCSQRPGCRRSKRRRISDRREEEETEKGQLLQFIKFNANRRCVDESITSPSVIRDLLLTMFSDTFHPLVYGEPLVDPLYSSFYTNK